MDSIFYHLDEIECAVMNELKDFQKATVERIDYLFRNGQKRVLVSDEVGLGKTLIARGTIAKFANLRKEEEDDLVKIVYICSNATIADQNLEKLRLVKEIKVDNVNTSRLSMQHLNIFMQINDENVLNRYIQLIPLTPDTSFRVSNSRGTKEERALMFTILKEIPDFEPYLDQLNELLRSNVKYWDDLKEHFQLLVDECNEKSYGEYIDFMINEVYNQLNEKDNDFSLMESLINYLEYVKFNQSDKFEDRNYIVQLRMLFADISLNILDPDLIIMDEFQRFKYLINSDENSEMFKLSERFFNNEDMRILMLSATPYKMYSTLDEITEDEIDAHYSEFFDVMNFLKIDENEQKKFKEVWNNYSIELKEFNKENFSFIQAKTLAENSMYENICRTERITENQLANIIDDNDAYNLLKVFKEDIESFIEAQKLLDDIGLNINVPIDYIKSSPYIMSFMKNYQLKKKIEDYFTIHPNEIYLMNKDTFWLNENDINNYAEIRYNNARLNNLITHVFKNNAEKLLWVPPSMPYYDLKGAFEDSQGFSKILLFSSWEMVPRMVSSMVSYEVERRTIGKLESRSQNLIYFAENRYPSARMRFYLNNEEPAQLNLFSLIYPSIFLIDIYDPIDCLNRNLSLEEIEFEIKNHIKMELDKIPTNGVDEEDLRWYYLAPLLLDAIYDEDSVDSWFRDIEELIDMKYYDQKGFIKHFEALKADYYYIFRNLYKLNDLGKQPDDLLDVLCDLAIASPAICAYRLYEKQANYEDLSEYYNQFSLQIAREFINFMNLPESIAVIDLVYKSKYNYPYWRNVLKYSKEGNIQAVFDEYVHLLLNGLYNSNFEKISIIHNNLLNSLNLKTTYYDIDTYDSFKSRINGEENKNISLRTHYAVAFTKGRSDQKDSNRKKSVRNSFNSPFRPFVLASTSIGQEGLDFHNYCRKIVHWNLPSNPIDLEQREGRINRFESLAIRQNIAKRYGQINFKKDIWNELFEYAAIVEGENTSDLIPFWGLKESEDMIKIERIIPMYPFSRDETKYERLIKILSLYRLTLGQYNQEYLLQSVFNVFDENYDFEELFINLSPYYRDQ